jgi:hypothetical protein
LPEGVDHAIRITNGATAPDRLSLIPFFDAVREPESMGKYGAIFDYKWVGCIGENGGRMHALAMLVWDGVLAVAIFHDASCSCVRCASREHVSR